MSFLKNLGIALLTAYTAFIGSFHTEPTPARSPITPITTTTIEATTTIVTETTSPLPSPTQLPNVKKLNLKASVTTTLALPTPISILLPTPSPTVSVYDVCRNIEGAQTLAPSGMYADNGNCFSLTTAVVSTPDPAAIKQVKIEQQQAQQKIVDQNAAAAKQQVLTQIQSECTDPTNALLQQILDIKTQYYSDLKNLTDGTSGRGVTDAGLQPELDGLLGTANSKITQINLQIDQIKLSCSEKYGI